MADKTIGELVAATAVTSTDLFVLQQNNTAKKLTAQILENWLVALADGHGGIQSIVETSSSGLVDTYTITLSDETTTTFTVTNGKAISSVTTYYAVSNSDSTAPASGWSTSYQQMTQTNRFLWSYEVIAFNDNTSITTEKVVIGVYGQKGDTGATGNGIASMSAGTHTPGSYTIYTFTFTNGTEQSFYSYDGVGISGIEKTSTSGLVDTYTISYTNNTTTTFTVTNAKSIVSITKTSTVGLVDTYTILFNDETSTMFTVSNGKSISSISKTSTSGLVDTYTISMNDGTTTTFTVTNGSSISTIAKTSTVGLVDTYTVTLTDGTTTSFTVTNAKSIVSVTMVSGTHAAGTTDTYRITFNDGDTTDFTVYNGTNGTGSVSTVDGITSTNQNVTLLLTGNGPPTESTVGQLKQRYFDLSNQILYICVGIDTSSNPATYSWAGTGVPVDSSLSSTSENPVQNKVITAKVGTAALNTTAQNLSGAVNELDADLAALPATVAPLMDGTAAVGSSQKLARQDHVHPHDSLITNRNLLDNWYFVGGGSQLGYGIFPVNQRGQGTYILSSDSYGIDRWACFQAGSKHTLNSYGVLIETNGTNYAQIAQKVSNFPQGTITISFLTGNVAPTNPVRIYLKFSDNTSNYYDCSDLGQNDLGYHTFTVSKTVTEIRFYTNASESKFSLQAVKAEIGSTQTLAHQENGAWVLNEVPDYATELAKCQAYYIKTTLVSEYSCALGLGGTNPRFLIPLPATMAKAPTFAKIGADPFVFGVGSSAVIVGSSSGSIQISGSFSTALLPNAVRVTFQTTDAVGAAFLPCVIEVPAFELSAE